ncbi:hypothetical transcript [Echinococcus multilocularis]|uniref:Hypothetical transcript n=1 Tax=Echinococcus multilocularis TaxID=6211 RepID=A0A087VW96_ECHMU|nr:hypothetical transcript [Echinococcus multilocularis]
MAGVLIDSETQVTHLVTHCQCQTVTPLTTETVMPVVADSSRLEVTPVVVAEEEGIIEPLSYAHIHSAAPVAVQLRSTAVMTSLPIDKSREEEWMSKSCIVCGGVARPVDSRSTTTELEAPEKVATVKVKGMMVDTLRENVGPCMTCTATQTQAWLSVAETTGNLAIPARASCRVKEIGVLATSVVRLFDLETQVTPMSVHAQCQTLSPLSLLSSPILPTSHAPAAAMVKSKSLQTCLDEASALKSVEMHATAAMVYTQVECASSSWLADAEMPRQFEGADYAALLRPRNEAEGYECVHASPRLVEMQHAYRITSQPSCIDTGMNTGVATVQHSFLPPLHGNTADVYADVVTTTQSIATVTTQTMAGVLIDSETQVTHLVTHCQCQTVTPLTTETVMPVVADSSRLEVTPVVVAEEEGIIEPLSYAHIHSAAPVAVQLRSTAVMTSLPIDKSREEEWMSKSCIVCGGVARPVDSRSTTTELEAPEKVATVKVKGMMVDTLRENVGPCMTCTATQTQAWLSVAETTGNLAIPARASCRVKEIGVLSTSVVRLFDLETQVTPMSVHAQCQTLSPLSLLSSPILPTSHAPAAAMVKSKSLQTCLDEASALKSVEMHATAAMVYTQVECASSSWLADAEMPRQFEGADYAALLRPRNEAEGYECVHASPRLVEMQHAYRITSQPSCIDTGMNTGVATVQHSFLPPLHGNSDVVKRTAQLDTARSCI